MYTYTYSHMQHLNNWQHAVMYFCFITSALVSIITYHAGLPEGTDKVCSTVVIPAEFSVWFMAFLLCVCVCVCVCV